MRDLSSTVVSKVEYENIMVFKYDYKEATAKQDETNKG